MNDQRLKIAFLVGKFPALSETFIVDQVTGLIDAGHEVDIFAQQRSEEAMVQSKVLSYGLLERVRFYGVPQSRLRRIWDGLKIVVKMSWRRKLSVFRALNVCHYGRKALSLRLLYLVYPFLEQGPYDIIHCHFGPVGMSGAQLKDLGILGKLIVTFHGHDISKFVRLEGDAVYRPMFEKADLLMPVSQYWKQKLIRLGAAPARVCVHHMGVDPAQFAFHPRSLKGADEIRLLTVGRLVEKKGIQFGLLAVSRLIERHPDWKIRYNIIGDGEQEDELRQLIHKLGLEENTQLFCAKAREEILQFMMDSHIFLLPSVTGGNGDQEGIPVVLMEAMATGMPIVSTLHTGIPELVTDGVSGYLVPERDVDGLTARLEQLITQPERWSTMGYSNRLLVEVQYNNLALNRQLIQVYHSLLDGTFESRPDERAPHLLPQR